MIKKFIICSLVLFAAYSLPAFAEDDEECTQEEGTDEWYMDPFCNGAQDDAPLDGGVTFLLGVATIYGIKTIKRNTFDGDSGIS
jgi:hypothetical protein